MIDTISILSCDREPSYLIETINSIPSNFNVEVFYQGDISKFNIDNVKFFTIKTIAEKSEVHKNSQFNYASSLLRTKCGLLIEDDVYLSNNFSNYLTYLNKSLINKDKFNYAIALYSCYDWGYEDLKLVDYPVDSFYGTQAMLYDIQTARNFGHFLMGRIGVEPYDLALKSFIHENSNTKLLASSRSIVQHAGQLTTGLGFFHQSQNFLE